MPSKMPRKNCKTMSKLLAGCLVKTKPPKSCEIYCNLFIKCQKPVYPLK